jgi:hypothetical protein
MWGNFGDKIKFVNKIFRGSFRAAKFLAHMLSLILRRIFWGGKISLFVELLKPFVSANSDFLKFCAVLGTLKIINNYNNQFSYVHAHHAHSFRHFVHPQHACKELMSELSIRVRN